MKKQKIEKKVNKRAFDKRLLKLWGQIVIAKHGGKCEYPGCHRTKELGFIMHPHHIYPRGRKNTRFDIDNGMCLCALHHTFGIEAAHQDPDFKTVIILANIRTKEFFDKLQQKSMVINKLNLDDIAEYLLSEYRKLIL